MKTMTRILVGLLSISFIAAGIAFAAAVFTPSGQLFEKPPTGHTPGKDNGRVTSRLGKGYHYVGKDCGICHAPGFPAGDYAFTVAGTIFKDKFGRSPLAGAEVILRDGEGKIISMTTNEAGNFWTYEPIAANPDLVALGADPAMPRNLRYKAWIKYGDTYRTMVTLAYLGAYEDYKPRMACNMHHGLNSSRGSASIDIDAPTLPVFASVTSSDFVVSFYDHVMPIIKNRCKGCHKPGMPESKYEYYDADKRKHTYELLSNNGGLDLSGYFDSETTTVSSGKAATFGILDKINDAYPVLSDLLVKPLVGGNHAGGEHWSTDGLDYKVIRKWIEQGALEVPVG